MESPVRAEKMFPVVLQLLRETTISQRFGHLCSDFPQQVLPALWFFVRRSRKRKEKPYLVYRLKRVDKNRSASRSIEDAGVPSI